MSKQKQSGRWNEKPARSTLNNLFSRIDEKSRQYHLPRPATGQQTLTFHIFLIRLRGKPMMAAYFQSQTNQQFQSLIYLFCVLEPKAFDSPPMLYNYLFFFKSVAILPAMSDCFFFYTNYIIIVITNCWNQFINILRMSKIFIDINL